MNESHLSHSKSKSPNDASHASHASHNTHLDRVERASNLDVKHVRLPSTRQQSQVWQNLFDTWSIGVLVVLATILALLVVELQSILGGWRLGLETTLTIVIPNDFNRSAAELETLSNDITRMVKKTAGVRDVNVVDPSHLTTLMQPWFGNDDEVMNLPLPLMIDVTLDAPESRLTTVSALSDRLRRLDSSITMETYSQWQASMSPSMRALQILIGLVLALVLGAILAVMLLVTGSALQRETYVIDVMRLVGAEESYIVRRFSLETLTLALRGILIGGVLLVLLGAGCWGLLRWFPGTLFFGLSEDIQDHLWMITATFVVVAVVIATSAFWGGARMTKRYLLQHERHLLG